MKEELVKNSSAQKHW